MVLTQYHTISFRLQNKDLLIGGTYKLTKTKGEHGTRFSNTYQPQNNEIHN